jgi:hypothetical protein
MARKVFISQDMSQDERLAELGKHEPLLMLMWPWLLTSFDDWGWADASPRRLKAQVFPMLSTISVEDIDTAKSVFAEEGLMQLYSVNGQRYMCIPPAKWYAHQTHIHSSKRKRVRSRFPAPPTEANIISNAVTSNRKNSACLRDSARVCAGVL